MADVTMPKLSDTMEEGKILRWLKQAGDQVAVGDLLVEVETDKADMEVEASAAGVLREVKLGEGESAAVGVVIAVIDGAGGDAKAAAKGDRAGPKQEAAPAQPQTAKAPQQEPAKEAPTEPADERTAAPKDASRSRAAADEAPPAKEKRTAGPEAEAEPQPEDPAVAVAKPRPTAKPVEAAAPRAAAPSRGGGAVVKASPLARALATELGVKLSSVRGTGPAGRITRHDVEQAAGSAVRSDPSQADTGRLSSAKAARSGATAKTPAKTEADQAEPAADRKSAATAPESAASDAAKVRRVPLSKMRASIAKRMSESKREAPHFYLTTVVDMDEAVRLRAQLKALEVSRAGVTYNHMVLKAVAGALADHPEINARFAGDAIELDPAVNVGIATAVDDGLIVPVLAGADRLSLLEIAEQARALAEKAESGRFGSADLSGATFSVSNLGMFDVDSFSAVINPPQAAILAVGSVKQRPVVRDGALAVGYTMAMTLSCDHRVIDGARGGRFLAEVKRRLENPVALLLDAEVDA